MFTSFLLAAALGLNPNNKVISPGLGSRVVVRTQAFLVDSQPGQYLLRLFTIQKAIFLVKKLKMFVLVLEDYSYEIARQNVFF